MSSGTGEWWKIVHGMPAAAAIVLEIRREEAEKTIMGKLGLAYCSDMIEVLRGELLGARRMIRGHR